MREEFSSRSKKSIENREREEGNNEFLLYPLY